LTVDLRGFLPEAALHLGMFFSSPASKSPLERGGPLAVGCVLFLKEAFHNVLRPERRGGFSSRQRKSLPDEVGGIVSLHNLHRHSISEDGGLLTEKVVFGSVQPLFPREAGIASWHDLGQPCVH